MADTIRAISSLQALLADNTTGDISPQDLRDMLVSLGNMYQEQYTTGWEDMVAPMNSVKLAGVSDPTFAAFGPSVESPWLSITPKFGSLTRLTILAPEKIKSP